MGLCPPQLWLLHPDHRTGAVHLLGSRPYTTQPLAPGGAPGSPSGRRTGSGGDTAGTSNVARRLPEPSTAAAAHGHGQVCTLNPCGEAHVGLREAPGLTAGPRGARVLALCGPARRCPGSGLPFLPALRPAGAVSVPVTYEGRHQRMRTSPAREEPQAPRGGPRSRLVHASARLPAWIELRELVHSLCVKSSTYFPVFLLPVKSVVAPEGGAARGTEPPRASETRRQAGSAAAGGGPAQAGLQATPRAHCPTGEASASPHHRGDGTRGAGARERPPAPSGRSWRTQDPGGPGPGRLGQGGVWHLLTRFQSQLTWRPASRVKPDTGVS